MIRYISSLFISISIYIGLIYGYTYFTKSIKSIKREAKRERESRVKITILERKKEREIKSKIEPKQKSKSKVKKIVHKIKKIKKIHTKSKKISYKPEVIYRPKPTRASSIYKAKNIDKIVKKEDSIKIDDLNIQKIKFLKRVRENIYSNRIYPYKARISGIEGRVHLVFDIISSGEAINIRTSNAPIILQKSVKNSLKRAFPIDIPPILLDNFPMQNISIDIDFKLF